MSSVTPCAQRRWKRRPEDHRVGDVGDLHLVEREEAGLAGDLVGHGEDGVVHAGRAGAGQRRLDPLHEGVEVLAADGDRVGQRVERGGP